jgi:hypothetical protein
MKFGKLLLAAAIGLSFSASVALADYNVGFKYYQKYIKRKTHIKGTQFLKILGVQTVDQLKALFKDNGKPLIEKLKATGHEKAAKAVEKIIKKGKLKDLEDFLVGMMEGKIPAGCS